MSRRALPPEWLLDTRDWPVRHQLALLRMGIAVERLKKKETRNV